MFKKMYDSVVKKVKNRQEKKNRKRNRREKQLEKIKEIESEYDELIKEYSLVLRRESKLSYKKRQQVVKRVLHLIAMGHITVTPR